MFQEYDCLTFGNKVMNIIRCTSHFMGFVYHYDTIWTHNQREITLIKMNNFKSSFTIPPRTVYRVFTLLINILTINRNYFKSIDSVYFLFQN